jgi:hypothetical protein
MCSELRNRIYDFCVESKTVVGYELIPASFGPTFEYRHLTQVCKQLRQEFRALYMASTTISFPRPGDFIRYAAAFYPNNAVREVQEDRGNIKLGFGVEHESFEALPILRLLAAAPGIRCNFEVGSILAGVGKHRQNQALVDELNDFLDYTGRTSSETWHHIMTTDVTSVIITRRPSKICFHLRQSGCDDAIEWWMDEGFASMRYWVGGFTWGPRTTRSGRVGR